MFKAFLPAKASGSSSPGGSAPETASSPPAEATTSYTEVQLSAALKALEGNIMRNLVLDHGQRGDGRGVTDIRPISSRAALLPRTHGSCLFTRGETQASEREQLLAPWPCLQSESKSNSSLEDGISCRVASSIPRATTAFLGFIVMTGPLFWRAVGKFRCQIAVLRDICVLIAIGLEPTQTTVCKLLLKFSYCLAHW